MVFTFKIGGATSQKAFAVTRAVDSVMNAPMSFSNNAFTRRFVDVANERDCAQELRFSLRLVARELIDANMSYSDFLSAPRMARKRSIENAIDKFQSIVMDQIPFHGEGLGQLLLVNMDLQINQYLASTNPNRSRSA